MTPHEELRALLGKLPNPERATELLEQVTLRPSDALQESVMEKIAEALGDAMDCTRVWSAWGVGTMSENDFVLVADDAERLAEIADAAISAVLEQVAAVPVVGEPVATKEGWGIDTSTGRRILVYKNCSVIEDEQANLVLRLLSTSIDSIPRARLDELLAAENRAVELEAALLDLIGGES